MELKIKYDGEFPNLCSGNLTVWVGKRRFQFPDHCLSSGGGVGFDEDGGEIIDSGPWEITEYPPHFPERYKEALLYLVNEQIPWGCCGGCV